MASMSENRPETHTKSPRNWLLGIDTLFSVRGDLLGFYENLHAQYGDAVCLRLGPYRNWVLFHPDHIEHVLTKQPDAFIRFERIMRILGQWNGSSLLIAEGESWRDRRRKVLPAFRRGRLPEYAQAIAGQCIAVRDRWLAAISENGSFACDVDAAMARLSLDIAGVTLFGKTLNEGSDDISAAIQILSETAFRETTSPLTLPDFLPLAAKRKKRRAVGLMKETIQGIVAERLHSSSGDRGDLLSILVDYHASDTEAIQDDAMSLLIAGHETSGATLTWLFYLLAKHRSVLAAVQQEIDAVTGDRPVAYTDLSQLPYLQSVVEETLRLYPAAYALFSRRAVRDVHLDGLTIRAGDLVQLFPYITQRDPRWFPDPSAFVPERFRGDPAWPKCAYFPFGAGPRVCIGQAFGFMEIMLVAGTILQRLEPQPLDADPVPFPRFSLRPRDGLNLVWRGRSS